MTVDRQVSPDTRDARCWQVSGPVLAILLCLLPVIYQDTVTSILELWSRVESGPYGHGFLVLAIACYLAWHRRDQLQRITPAPAAVALPVVAACVLAWLAAALVDIQLVQMVMLLPLVLSVAWAVSGARVARLLCFPVLFVLLALPVWSPLLPVLRLVTVTGAFALVHLAGITAHLQDYRVQLPSGQLSIEEACSGLNYLLSGLALGLLYARLYYRRTASRVLVVAIVALSAILANIMRVFIIVYVAYSTEMQHPLVRDHMMLGWYLFGALVLLLLAVDRMIFVNSTGPVIEPQPVIRSRLADSTCYRSPRGFLLLVPLVLLLASGPATAWWLKMQAVTDRASPLQLPPGHAGWLGPDRNPDDWKPEYHGAVAASGGYQRAGERVQLYIGLYTSQHQGSELINDLNRITDDAVWQQAQPGRAVLAAGRYHLVETTLVNANDQRRLVWYCYRIAGRYTTSRPAAKLLQLLGLLQGRNRAALVAMAAEPGQDAARARQALQSFLAAMMPELARAVDGNAINEDKPGNEQATSMH